MTLFKDNNKNEDYLKYIEGKDCTINEGCMGDVFAHHLIPRRRGRNDYQTVPLCFKHHGEAHQYGKKDFWNGKNSAKAFIDPKGEVIKHLTEYIKRGK